MHNSIAKKNKIRYKREHYRFPYVYGVAYQVLLVIGIWAWSKWRNVMFALNFHTSIYAPYTADDYAMVSIRSLILTAIMLIFFVTVYCNVRKVREIGAAWYNVLLGIAVPTLINPLLWYAILVSLPARL